MSSPLEQSTSIRILRSVSNINCWKRVTVAGKDAVKCTRESSSSRKGLRKVVGGRVVLKGVDWKVLSKMGGLSASWMLISSTPSCRKTARVGGLGRAFAAAYRFAGRLLKIHSLQGAEP